MSLISTCHSWTETELAYFAGIIDGEGCITATATKREVHYIAHLQVVTTDKPLVDWIVDHFGGNYYHRHPPAEHPTWKDKFDWFAYVKSMDAILPAILPYLIIKQEIAEVMIRFRQTFTPVGTNKRLPTETRLLRRSLYDQIKQLNRQHKSR